jgi:molecular chaperone HtpG
LAAKIFSQLKRISDKEGKPLSQAASGCHYLIRQLEEAASQGRSELSQLWERQPLIVVERTESDASGRSTSRELVSPAEMENIPFFWTIDSRSVDSLGLISRDLGREFGLNQFLHALAPDLTQLNYSPILPDAHMSAYEIRRLHMPERVEFSRKHQQSATKWVRRAGLDASGLNVWDVAAGDDAVNRKIHLILAQSEGSTYLNRVQIRRHFDIDSAPIIGEDTRVMAIKTRLGVILKPGSMLMRIWHTIRGTVVTCLLKRSSDDSMCSLRIATAFDDALNERDSAYHYGATDAHTVWQMELPRFRGLLEELGCEEEPPPSHLRDLVGRGVVFNATAFWRNWDRF